MSRCVGRMARRGGRVAPKFPTWDDTARMLFDELRDVAGVRPS